MGKYVLWRSCLSKWWAKITAPYEEEAIEEYREAARFVCSFCEIDGRCSGCPVRLMNGGVPSMDNYAMIYGEKVNLTEDLIDQILAEHKREKFKLSEAVSGDVVAIGKYEFVVLAQGYEATSVILKDLYGDLVAFGNNNNYDGSTVDGICCDFFVELAEIVGSENIIPHDVDLTADDGLKDYGQIERAVSLLTAEQYRYYVEVLDQHKVDEYWWLATPASTPAHANARWAKCVAPSGYVFNIYLYNDVGVRPFCVLKSDIFVSR